MFGTATKILIVDPNAGASANARRFLLGVFDEIFVARGVAEGVRIAERESPSVVILDADLAAPYTMHNLARVLDEGAHVILAGTSPEAEKMLFVAIEDVRIAGVVRKPYESSELVDIIGQLTAPGDEDPTVDALPAIPAFDTIQDPPEVSAEAERLAAKIESELPGLIEDPDYRRLIARVAALAVEKETLDPDTVEVFESEPPTTGEIALEGRIGPIPAEHVFQLAENMAGPVAVSFARGDDRVDLYFEDRHLVHATGTGSTADLDIQRLVVVALGWNGADFVIKKGVSFPQTPAEALPVPFVLLEGMRLLDEATRKDSDPGTA